MTAVEQLTLVELDDWTPRYTAYARAHGHTPADMIHRDRDLYPGGHMAGFTIWLDQQWRAFGIEPGSRAITDAEHAAFDAWLNEREAS